MGGPQGGPRDTSCKCELQPQLPIYKAIYKGYTSTYAW